MTTRKPANLSTLIQRTIDKQNARAKENNRLVREAMQRIEDNAHGMAPTEEEG